MTNVITLWYGNIHLNIWY